MSEIIYIKLLNEGTEVYRPVISEKLNDNVYEVGGAEIYNPNDETWEFQPGSHVIVKHQQLQSGKFLVAVHLLEDF